RKIAAVHRAACSPTPRAGRRGAGYLEALTASDPPRPLRPPDPHSFPPPTPAPPHPPLDHDRNGPASFLSPSTGVGGRTPPDRHRRKGRHGRDSRIPATGPGHGGPAGSPKPPTQPPTPTRP